MKRLFLILTICLVFLNIPIYGQNDSIIRSPNPAVEYCRCLGYKIEIVKDARGNESGLCRFPDGSSAGDFAFFRGEMGEEWSYGYRLGYHVAAKTVSNEMASMTYANCTLYDESGNLIEEISQIELLKRDGVSPFKDDNLDVFLEIIRSSKVVK